MEFSPWFPLQLLQLEYFVHLDFLLKSLCVEATKLVFFNIVHDKSYVWNAFHSSERKFEIVFIKHNVDNIGVFLCHLFYDWI